MNRAQLLGVVFLVMGLGHAGIAARSIVTSGGSTINALYLLASLTILALAVLSIYRPAWVDNEDLAGQRVTKSDLRIVAVTVLALLLSVFIGYSFVGWLP